MLDTLYTVLLAICSLLCSSGGEGIAESPDLKCILELPLFDVVSIPPEEVVKHCTPVLAKREQVARETVTKTLARRGWAFLQTHKFEEARKDFDDLCKMLPRHAEPRYLRALAFHGLKRPKDLVADAKRATQLDPAYAPGYYVMALAVGQQGDLTASLEMLHKAISLDPKFAPAYYLRAIAYMQPQLDDPALSLSDMDRFLQLAPSLVPSSPDMPYYSRGLCLSKLNRPHEALGSFLMARKLTPSAAHVAHRLADTYADLGRFELALHYAQEFVRLDPASPTGYGLTALYCSKTGRKNEALKAADKFLSFAADDPTILAVVGRVHHQLHNYRQALLYFDKALARYPEHVAALLDKASLLASCPNAELRAGEEAVRLASKVYARKTLKPWTKWAPAMVLAEAHAECGRFEEAVRLTREAIAPLSVEDWRRAECVAKLRLFEKKMPYRAPAAK